MKKLINRKNILKTLSVIMILAMMLSFTACGKKDGDSGSGSGGSGGSGGTEDITAVMTEVTEKISAVNSYTFDMTMDIGMEVMEQSMDMKTTSTGEAISKPLAAHMKATSEMGVLGSYETESYVREEDGKTAVYTGMDLGDGEIMWIKQIEDISSTSAQFNAQASIDMYVKSADSFTEAGTEDVNGKKATRYDGVIKGEAIKDAIEASGINEELGMVGDIDIADLFEQSDELIVSIWVTEDKMPIKYEMDMTSVMKTIVDKVMEQELQGATEGEGAIDLKVGINKALISMTFTGFDNVDAIDIPEDVINNAESFDDADLLGLEEELEEEGN